MAWVFPEFVHKTCGHAAAATVRIELGIADRRSGHIVDWTSPTVCTHNPFNDIPNMSQVLEAEVGTLAGGSATFTADNFVVTGTTRIFDILTSVHPRDYEFQIRISRKPAGGAYAIIWWGLVTVEDLECTMKNPANPDTWRIQFQAVNGIHQLDEIDFDTVFVDAYLPHTTYDVSPGAVYISAPMGPLSTMTRTQLTKIEHYDGVTRTWINATDLRFFKLTDVLQAISNGAGITTTLNNGAATQHSWEYVYWDGSADVPAAFDELYVPSCVYFGGEYQHDYGLFDPEGTSEGSIYNAGSALEALKALVVPHGLVARISFTAAGARYLEVMEVEADSGVAFASYQAGVKYKPADRLLGGLKVTVPNFYDVLIGSGGDSSTAIRCIYTTANRLLTGTRGVGATDDLSCLYRALFVKHGTTFENVYKINVASAGRSGTWGQGLTARAEDGKAASIVGMAAAYYWFNPLAAPADEPVGIYRRMMRRLELTVARFVPDSELAVRHYIDFAGQNWWVREKTWDMRSGHTSFVAECGDW